MSCDVGKATEGLENWLWRRWREITTEGLENGLWRRWSDWKLAEWEELIVIVIAELILQSFRHFTYVTTHSPTLSSLYLRHSSFSNPSVASPTSQFILQPFCCFTYVTAHSRTLLLLLLHHRLFTWQAAHDEGGTHKCRQVLRMVILTNFKFWIVKKGHEIMHNTHKLYFSIY